MFHFNTNGTNDSYFIVLHHLFDPSIWDMSDSGIMKCYMDVPMNDIIVGMINNSSRHSFDILRFTITRGVELLDPKTYHEYIPIISESEIVSVYDNGNASISFTMSTKDYKYYFKHRECDCDEYTIQLYFVYKDGTGHLLDVIEGYRIVPNLTYLFNDNFTIMYNIYTDRYSVYFSSGLLPIEIDDRVIIPTEDIKKINNRSELSDVYFAFSDHD